MLRSLIALTCLLAGASVARAQTAEEDVRCILAGNAFAQAEKDPNKKQVAILTGLFFAGRADARLSPAQLKAMLASQMKVLNNANAGQTMTSCAKTFAAKQQALIAIGQQVAQTQQKK